VCATAGRKKYGPEKFARMAAAGRKRAAAKENAGKYSYRKTKKLLRKHGYTMKSSKRRKYGTRAGSSGSVAARRLVDFYRENGPKKRKSKKISAATIAAYQKIFGGKISKGALEQIVRDHRRNRGPVRKNPLDEAKAAYKTFHGRDPEKIVVTNERVHHHKYLSGIGELVRMVIVTPDGRGRVTLTFSDGKTLLAQNEKKNQLFIRGGDQSVDLAQFGIHAPVHEKEVLGELQQIRYFTRKDHLRPADGGTAVYRHNFSNMRELKLRGKRVSRRWTKPTVIYDTVDKLLEIAGGAYTIPAEGIDH
jgi:hypothetical protein